MLRFRTCDLRPRRAENSAETITNNGLQRSDLAFHRGANKDGFDKIGKIIKRLASGRTIILFRPEQTINHPLSNEA